MTPRIQFGPRRTPATLAQLAGPWWLFLATGVAWLIISAVVLRFSIASVAAVAVLIGVVFLVAAVRSRLLCRLHPIGPVCVVRRLAIAIVAHASPRPCRSRVAGAMAPGQKGKPAVSCSSP